MSVQKSALSFDSSQGPEMDSRTGTSPAFLFYLDKFSDLAFRDRYQEANSHGASRQLPDLLISYRRIVVRITLSSNLVANEGTCTRMCP